MKIRICFQKLFHHNMLVYTLTSTSTLSEIGHGKQTKLELLIWIVLLFFNLDQIWSQLKKCVHIHFFTCSCKNLIFWSRLFPPLDSWFLKECLELENISFIFILKWKVFSIFCLPRAISDNLTASNDKWEMYPIHAQYNWGCFKKKCRTTISRYLSNTYLSSNNM